MFGLSATNDYGELLFSDSSAVLEYLGKATWQKRYNNNSPGNVNPRYWQMEGYAPVYSRPHYVVNEYLIAAPSSDLLCFVHVPWPSFTAIQYTTPVEQNLTRLNVIGQVFDVPEVYCFRKIAPKSGGYGMSLWDSAGNLTFTTNSRMLVPRAASVVAVPYTSQFTQAWSQNRSFSFAVNGSDQNTTYTQINGLIRPVGHVAKPAIAYYPAITGVVQSGSSNSYYDFIESAVRYRADIGAIEHQWGSAANTYINSGAAEIRVPAHSQFCVVIDGTAYD